MDINEKKEIALCFLTYDNLSKPKLWQQFDLEDNRFNFYIHNKKDFDGYFNQYCIKKKIETQWGKLSLVKASLLLFEEALLNENNKYFILLSDKTIPLFDPDTLYKKIIEIEDNLIFKFRVRWRGRLKDKTLFNGQKKFLHHQWILLNRKTTKFVVENDYTDEFGTKCIVPDERYFGNILTKFNIEFKNKMSTFANWKQKSDSRKYRRLPKTYLKLKNSHVKEIIKKDCLFMRKVPEECELPSYFDNFTFPLDDD